MDGRSLPLLEYEAADPKRIRLFQLDLNEEHEPLSGKLLSYATPVILDSKTAFLKTFGSTLRSDDDYIIEELGGGDGYDAVSWCWGPEGRDEPLILATINRKLGKGSVVQMDTRPNKCGFIRIRPALAQLLRLLRRQQHKRFLWIDAICINQKSNADKQAQLPNLRRIYSEAESVLIFFEGGGLKIDNMLSILPAVTKALEQCASNDVKLWRFSTWTKFNLPLEHDEFWVHVRSLFMNPWWSRLWTLQEVVVTSNDSDDSDDEEVGRADVRRVLYGDSTISWWALEDFAMAAKRCHIRDWIITGNWLAFIDDKHGFDAIDEVRTCRASLQSGLWGVRFNASLLATMRRKVTYAKDIIFGQTALMDQDTVNMFQLLAEEPLESLFLQFGKQYIQQELHERLLNHTATKEQLPGLPSWCPNFASERDTMPLGSRWLGKFVLADIELDPDPQFYRAGFSITRGPYKLVHHDHTLPIRPYFKVATNRITKKVLQSNWYNSSHRWDLQIVPNQPFIRLSGVDVDVVTDFVECNPAANCEDFLSLTNVRQTSTWHKECLSLALRTIARENQESNRESVVDLLARTLTANRIVIRPRKEEDKIIDEKLSVDFFQRHKNFQEILESTLEKGEAWSIKDIEDNTLDHVTTLRCITRRRRFFATAAGRIGIGPSTTAVGDRLCICFFCPTPYLLRRTPKRYQLVGESYVHGLMYGEALQMHQTGELAETQWEIE